MVSIDAQEVTEDFIARVAQYREKPEGKGLLESCSDNPVLFCTHMVGVVPYDWQAEVMWAVKEWVDGRLTDKELDNVIAAMTSRQIGKSFVLAVISLWLTIFNKVPDKSMHNTRVAIISRSDRQAKTLLREIKLWMRHGDRFMRETYLDEDDKPVFGKKFFDNLLSVEDPNNTQTITFKNSSDLEHDFLLCNSRAGSWIGSYPPTSVVLGETFTVGMIDEAAHPSMDDEFIIRELLPTGTANDALWITTSTPWRAAGWFYNIIHSDDGVKRFIFDIEAIKHEVLGNQQYLAAMRDIDKLRSQGEVSSVNIIYYCKFEQGDINYFNPPKVVEVFDDSLSMVDSYVGLCDLGLDFGGKVKSRTVITISRLTDDGDIERLYHHRYGVNEDDNIVEDVARLLMRFNVQRIIPDDCAQGDYVIRDMVNRGWNVQPDGRGMNFRRDKVKKYGAFRAMMNKGRVKSYPDHVLRDELMGMENSQTAVQSRIMPGSGQNDDMVDSFIMSCYFMLEDNKPRIGFVDWDDL